MKSAVIFSGTDHTFLLNIYSVSTLNNWNWSWFPAKMFITNHTPNFHAPVTLRNISIPPPPNIRLLLILKWTVSIWSLWILNTPPRDKISCQIFQLLSKNSFCFYLQMDHTTILKDSVGFWYLHLFNNSICIFNLIAHLFNIHSQPHLSTAATVGSVRNRTEHFELTNYFRWALIHDQVVTMQFI